MNNEKVQAGKEFEDVGVGSEMFRQLGRGPFVTFYEHLIENIGVSSSPSTRYCRDGKACENDEPG